MIELIFSNNTITFHGNDYSYEQVEKIDDLCVHVFMGGQIIAFLGRETSINGKLLLTADEIIAELNNV